MATEEGSTQKVEVHEMTMDEDQVRQDWRDALGLDKLDEHPDALTLAQLMDLLDLPSRRSVERWADRGVADGTVERVMMYRNTGSGLRQQKGYRLLLIAEEGK